MRSLTLTILCLLLAAPAAAEVADSSANGFTVRNVAVIAAHPSHLTLEARPGGCLCERLPNGGVAHLTVVYIAAPQEIRFSGGLGPLQRTGVAGSMIWKLTESTGTTQFEWAYTVGGYMPGGLAAIAPAVDGVLAEQLQRLKRFVETGRPD